MLYRLIQQLPMNSRFRAAAEGHPGERWDVGSWLSAEQADLIQQLIRITFSVHTGKSPGRFKPLPRPGDRRRKEPRPEFLRLVDEEGGEVQPARGTGVKANQTARDLLAMMRPGADGAPSNWFTSPVVEKSNVRQLTTGREVSDGGRAGNL